MTTDKISKIFKALWKSLYIFINKNINRKKKKKFIVLAVYNSDNYNAMYIKLKKEQNQVLHDNSLSKICVRHMTFCKFKHYAFLILFVPIIIS